MEECNSGAAREVDNPLMALPDVDLLRGLAGPQIPGLGVTALANSGVIWPMVLRRC